MVDDEHFFLGPLLSFTLNATLVMMLIVHLVPLFLIIVRAVNLGFILVQEIAIYVQCQDVYPVIQTLTYVQVVRPVSQ